MLTSCVAWSVRHRKTSSESLVTTHPPEHLARKRSPAIVIILVLVLLAAGFFLWHAIAKPKPKAAGPQGIPVSSAPVTVGDIDVYLDALGTVTPVYTVTVVSRVAGQITEVHFKEGQLVKKNDLLAVIDPRPYTAVMVEGEGQLARDEASLKNARIDLVRYQESYKEHAIPQQQLATQEALVEQDAGSVKLDRGTLDAARVNVDYTRILSPIDGRVGLRNIDPGNVVTANGTTGLCVVTQLQPITVIFTIAEDSIDEVFAQMNAGHPLAVTAMDRSKERTLATGSFANEHNELFPSQFVNARLLLKTLSQVNLVPQAAVQRNNDVAFVYVIQPDDTVQLRDIKILATEGEKSAVTGVNAGDQLVTDGFDKLQNGAKIRHENTPAAEAGQTPQKSG